jgi:hypothetical protein
MVQLRIIWKGNIYIFELHTHITDLTGRVSAKLSRKILKRALSLLFCHTTYFESDVLYTSFGHFY